MKKIKQTDFLGFYSALIEGDKNKCIHIIQNLLSDGVSLKDIYVDLFQAALYRIGNLWDHNKISVSEEHLSTKIIESLISRFAPINDNDSIKKAVVTCIDKEFHEIGAKMVANIFEQEGWKTFYLGASVPVKDIIKFVKQIDPEIIALSWGLYLNLGRFLETVDHLTKFYPTKKIYVGGQALAENSDKILKKYKNVVYIDSLNTLETIIKQELSVI